MVVAAWKVTVIFIKRSLFWPSNLWLANPVHLDPAAIMVEMQKYQSALSSFQFKRAKADLIQVFNEDSYLMAEYNERTGAVSWQRVLLATQREIVEKWLRERYPVQARDVKRSLSDRRPRSLSGHGEARRRRVTRRISRALVLQTK